MPGNTFIGAFLLHIVIDEGDGRFVTQRWILFYYNNSPDHRLHLSKGRTIHRILEYWNGDLTLSSSSGIKCDNITMAVPDDDLPLRPPTVCVPPPESSWGRSLVHQAVIGLLAVVVLTVFVNYPMGSTAVGGVLVLALCAYLLEAHDAKDSYIPVTNKAVVITGCDTGFGHELAKYLASLGVTVFAGCLTDGGPGAQKLRMLHHGRLHVLQMDVTNDEQVAQACSDVTSMVGDKVLWGVVNNAGLNFMGDVELTTMEQFSRVTNINQLGMVRVTKAFLPLIRRSRGRIVNVTSVKGRLSVPFNAAYGMTKFAGETFSDILRLEMNRFGVHVAIIQPCNFGGATGCLDKTRLQTDFDVQWKSMSEEAKHTYGKSYMDAHLTAAQESVLTASFNLFPVIDAMTHALFAANPKIRYMIGGGSGVCDWFLFRTRISQCVPTWLMDRIMANDMAQFPLPKGGQQS